MTAILLQGQSLGAVRKVAGLGLGLADIQEAAVWISREGYNMIDLTDWLTD